MKACLQCRRVSLLSLRVAQLLMALLFELPMMLYVMEQTPFVSGSCTHFFLRRKGRLTLNFWAGLLQEQSLQSSSTMKREVLNL